MANFEEFKQQTAEAAEMIAGKSIQFAKMAAEKTKQLARIAKLKAEMIAEKDSLRKAFLKLGKLYYEAYGHDPADPLAETVGNINEMNARIKEMKARIEEIKAESSKEASVVNVEIEITVLPDETNPEETLGATDEESASSDEDGLKD
jgi:hypothetical protein